LIEFLHDPSRLAPGLKSPPAPKIESQKAYSLQRTGDDFFTASRFDAAKDFYQKSLDLYREAGDSQAMAATLQRWGRAVELTGEYAQARAGFRESLQLFEALSDLSGIARAKAHLGSLAWALGEYAVSDKYLEESLALYKVGEDKAGEAWVLDLLGNVKLATRDDEGAESFHRAAFELIQELGVNLENLAWNDYHLGTLALYRGQLPEAQKLFSGALKNFTKLKDDLGQAAALTHLGEVACAKKDFSGAGKHLKRAVQSILPTQCRPLLADALTVVARLMKDQGEERKAVSLLMVALSHPTCRQQTKDRMVDLALSLNVSFSADEAKKGFAWAKTLSLEDMASGWAGNYRW
jgi:tetratricopeptide (TPR) repeat protein